MNRGDLNTGVSKLGLRPLEEYKPLEPPFPESSNDCETQEQVRDYHKAYGELDDLELFILMTVHTHEPVHTGIWIGSELGDVARMVEKWVEYRLEQEARR